MTTTSITTKISKVDGRYVFETLVDRKRREYELIEALQLDGFVFIPEESDRYFACFRKQIEAR